ncbi:MAG: hypothetical protein IJW63_08540 [Lachnospiraceae bacterium]|nr:hypothetical protein [Lachnospiraceae bacterium]
MILTYKECIEKYGNDYQLTRAVAEKSIYRVEPGVYSTERYSTELEVIIKKYPNAIFTGEYAFYHHRLTDVIPEKYHIATKAKAAKLLDARIEQIYVRDDLLQLGVVEKEINGVTVKIYDKERMLIELLRNKNSMPYDLYKEIISSYRKIIASLQVWRIQEYADIFPKSKMIKKALEEEVF